MHLPPLISGTLVRRYKRFLADIELDDGNLVTAHCANPGAMTGLAEPGFRVFLSRSSTPGRKLPLSWELVDTGSRLVCINTGRANAIVAEAIGAGMLPSLAGYVSLQREVRLGGTSRIDMMLAHPGRADCYVEVKSVTLFRDGDLALFPDAPTARGARHLADLSAAVADGRRAAMVYLVQGSAGRFSIAADIDPAYASAFVAARAAGVEIIAVRADISTNDISAAEELRIIF